MRIALYPLKKINTDFCFRKVSITSDGSASFIDNECIGLGGNVNVVNSDRIDE